MTMPVDDHPVHPRTIQGAGAQYGCHSDKRPNGMAAGYYAETRVYTPDGMFSKKLVWIPHNMSTKCRQINNLPECEGCTAEKDVEYIERMMQL